MVEPAFPCVVERGAPLGGFQFFPGMTLRDWFAGQALQSALNGATNLGEVSAEERAKVFDGLSVILYEIADAMLAERSK